MNTKIAALILAWHKVYVALGNCIESARIVLDQSDRGTLLPDRVREMRGEMLATLERIPKLALLMETLTDQKVWPMTTETDAAPDEETGAEPETVPEDRTVDSMVVEAAIAATGDYDAEGNTPVETAPVDEEAAAETVPEDPATTSEPDATGAP